ncbi:MAG: tetratricopeptide repeat protein [Acidobacteria bacterium]|nr:tetratricopeptide repeat protein [Acidobacteriota bacterium]
MTLEGTKVRNTTLLRRLGRGGMGEVYEGRDEKLQRLVAVKVLRAERRLDPLAKRRFLREARILSRVEHPNICRVLDFVEGQNTDFIVLELVPGTTLDQAIEQGLTTDEKRSIADQIASALAAAHALGIVHRDLKPSNIMVAPDGTVKILDFGLARTVDESSSGSFSSVDAAEGDPASQKSLTVTGGVLGTPAYMSPEQARGEPVSAASDMYSFGLILQKLFTELEPYAEGIGHEELLNKAMWGDTVPATGLQRGLSRLVADLEQLDPSARPTADSCVDRLRWVWNTSKRRIKRAAWVALGATLVLATVVSVLGFVRARRAQLRAESSEAAAQRAEAQAVAVNKFLADMLAAADPRRMGRDVKVIDILDQAAEGAGTAFGDEPLTEAAIRNTLGATYLSLGALDKAQEHLERASLIRSSLLGPDSLPALQTRTDLAKLLMAQGKLDDAEKLLAKITAACQRLWRDENQVCPNSATQYGKALLYQRKFGEALTVLERVRSALPAGAETAGRLDADLVLASVLREVDRDEEAEALIREAISTSTRVLGKVHPTTLRALQDLAILEDRRGNPEQAEEHFRQILSDCSTVFGPDHPSTLRTTLNVAISLTRLGRMKKAEEILVPLVAVCREKLGPVHMTTLESLRCLGWTISEQENRRSEAEPIYRRRYDDTRRLLGPEHRVTLEAESALASYYLFVGRHHDAEVLYRDALAKRRRVFGEDHPATQRSKRDLAKVLRATGRETEARSLS